VSVLSSKSSGIKVTLFALKQLVSLAIMSSNNKRSVSARTYVPSAYNPKFQRGPAYNRASGSVNLKAAAQALAAAAPPSTMRTGGFSFSSTGGTELNFVDTAAGGTDSTTARVVLLNGLAQGTTASTRIGRRVTMKSIELKGRVSAGSTGTLAAVRYALVLDKQANAAAPAFTDIYDAALPESLRNISNKARFQVLWDSGLTAVVGSSATPTDAARRTMEFYKKIGIPVQYNAGTAGTVGDIQTNALYFVAIGDVASGTGAPVSVVACRVRYDDK